jgi:hypothetical protein
MSASPTTQASASEVGGTTRPTSLRRVARRQAPKAPLRGYPT